MSILLVRYNRVGRSFIQFFCYVLSCFPALMFLLINNNTFVSGKVGWNDSVHVRKTAVSPCSSPLVLFHQVGHLFPSISDRNSILMIWNLSRILPGAIDYKWQSKDKWSNVNELNLLQNSQYSWNIQTLLKKKSFEFCRSLFQKNTKFIRNWPGETKNPTNLHLEPL